MTKYAEIAENWAAQTGKKRRTGRVSYNGDTIYSYGAAIGRLVRAANDDTVALITSHKYGSSTSMHTGVAADAARKLFPTFVVPALTSGGSHAANLAYFDQEIADLKERMRRGRPTSITHYTTWIAKVKAERARYVETFNFHPQSVADLAITYQ